MGCRPGLLIPTWMPVSLGFSSHRLDTWQSMLCLGEFSCHAGSLKTQRGGNELQKKGLRNPENSREVPQKLKLELPYNPAIALLGIYPKDTNVVIWRGTCTSMFMVLMSTIAKPWKEPRCPSTDERIKMWYIYIYVQCTTTQPSQKWNLVICNNMVANRIGYYAKWNKSIRER